MLRFWFCIALSTLKIILNLSSGLLNFSRELGEESLARETFEDYVVYLQEKAKEKERKREEEKVSTFAFSWECWYSLHYFPGYMLFYLVIEVYMYVEI